MRYEVKLPKMWTKDLAYFCGLVTGDGSLPQAYTKRPNGNLQKRHIIFFVCEEMKFTITYQKLFKRLFGLRPRISPRKKESGNIIYECKIESMQIYNYLKKLGMTTGKKAKIAKVPKMPKVYHKHFLAGLLDTDGGKKGSGFGLSTASKKLATFCMKMFRENEIKFNSCPWKYNDHIYHQIYAGKIEMKKILNKIPMRHSEKIRFIKYGC